MPTGEEVKEYFDRVAREWDAMRRDYYGVEVIDKSVAAAGLTGATRGSEAIEETDPAPPTDLLVDVGCGTGFLTAGLAPLAARMIGVDDSEGMLQVARENLDALGLRNVELRQGSVESLPLESDVADAVFANMVLHHAPDPGRMVSEMVRVAKPGGHVVITDMDSHSNEWFRAEMADLWLGFTEQQMHDYLEGAGLVDVRFGPVGTQ